MKERATPRGWRSLAWGMVVVVATLAAIQLSGTPARAEEGSAAMSVEPVTFQVENVNRSKLACNSNGAAYDISGFLVDPRAPGLHESLVTLYLHGAAGDYWRFQDVPGYDYALEMARLGQTSVVIDRLGYNHSPDPNGLDVCYGSQADMAHQVVAKLRSGNYMVDGGQGTAFARVALAGHSAGGLTAQVEAYSFNDVDALIDMSWADQGQSPAAGMEAAKVGLDCGTGGEHKYEPAGPASYVYFIKNPQDFKPLIFYNAEPAVVEAVTATRERDPCGDVASAVAGIAADHALLGTVAVPVLLVFGQNDALFSATAGDQQKANYTGTPDLSLVTIPNTGHGLFLERAAPEVRRVVATWLSRHAGTSATDGDAGARPEGSTPIANHPAASNSSGSLPGTAASGPPGRLAALVLLLALPCFVGLICGIWEAQRSVRQNR